MCIVIICFLDYDVINFEINLSFLVKQFFFVTIKSGQKFKYLKNEKSFFRWNKKQFLSFLKEFYLFTGIVSDLRVGFWNKSFRNFAWHLFNCVKISVWLRAKGFILVRVCSFACRHTALKVLFNFWY